MMFAAVVASVNTLLGDEEAGGLDGAATPALVTLQPENVLADSVRDHIGGVDADPAGRGERPTDGEAVPADNAEIGRSPYHLLEHGFPRRPRS